MSDQQLIEFVARYFCETATWPTYFDLNLQLIKSGGIEPVLKSLPNDSLVVWSLHDEEELRFASLDAYLEYMPCGKSDLDKFAKAAGFFGKRASLIKDRQSPEYQVSVEELKTYLEINGIELSRVIGLISQFGYKLQSGGSFGPDKSRWTFRLSSEAAYFIDVTTFDEFKHRLGFTNQSSTLRGEREKRKWDLSASDFQVEERSFALESEGEVDAIQLERYLHPAVLASCRELFCQGHYMESVRNASQRFESFLQDLISDHKTHGLKLASKVLSGNPPLIALNSGISSNDENEQEGVHYLARGIMTRIRNYYSHGHHNRVTNLEAFEYLMLISTVWKMVENKRKS